MKKNLLLFSAIALTSCASSLKPVKPIHQTISYPDLNTVLKKEIGESLIVKSDVEKYEAIKIVSLPDRKLFVNKTYILSPGDVLPLLAKTGSHDLFFKKESVSETKTLYNGDLYTTFSLYGIARNIKQPEKINPFTRSTTGYLGGTNIIQKGQVLTEPSEYISIDCDGCKKKEFIYNGKVGNGLKFIYREYVEDLARPAFTQDLQYDLSESNIIGFKGLRIEVNEATNTEITYSVVSYFTD